MDQLPGIIYDATTRLFSCAKVRAAYICKFEENLQSLKTKCEDLQHIASDVRRKIKDAEDMGELRGTDEANHWLQKVEHFQKEMDIVDSQQSRGKYISGCCPKNCVSSYKLGKKVVKMLKEADGLVKWKDKNFDITYKPPFREVIEMPSDETVGLDSMFNKVWNSVEDENVSIIGLYGMGGVGKTTLLKKVNNEFGKRKDKVDLVLWVVVSKDLDIDRIMNDIRNRLGVSDNTWNKSSQVEKAAKIYQVLKHKKFVLMLDDLWRNLDLKSVGVPFPQATGNQSKVLFTTRNEDVCAKMQAQKKFEVKCLSEKEAFGLFVKKVGEETLQQHGEIPKLAWEMTKECKGLPLALITIGSAMAGVKSIEAWKDATNDLRSSSWTASGLVNEVFNILKFSYDKLPDEKHKNCFLYCSLYPEDSEVDVNGLIDRWIGEGFLNKDRNKKSIYKMYEEGQSIIEKLKLSCLLEAVEIDDLIHYWFPTIKMHDVIRDMALWLGRDQDRNIEKVVVEGEALPLLPKVSERMSVMERISILNQRWQGQVPACPNLLTLCLSDVDGTIDFSNFQSMTRLKVLDLSGFDEFDVPTEVGNLINLEFLKLSKVYLRGKMPIAMKNLKKLRVFLMEEVFNDIDIIPLEVIASLEQLKVFRFSSSVDNNVDGSSEMTFLEKLESLPNLEELCFVFYTITGIQKLLNSTRLQDCSRRISLMSYSLQMPSLPASLSRMKHLENFALHYVAYIEEGSFTTGTCHLHNLRQVHISECNSITHLTWLKYAPLVEFVLVYQCESIEQVVMENKDEDDGTNSNNANETFSNLRYLLLKYLPELKSIHNRALAFPHLKFIDIIGCPDLRKLPFNLNSGKDSLIVIKGEQEWWDGLEWEDTAIKDLFHSKLQPCRF